MSVSFSKQNIFPIIGSIIDSHLILNDSINRDEIAQKLLNNAESKNIIIEAFKKYKTNNPLNVSGNMVDWFSAEITKESDIALPWVNKYFRKRAKIKGRKVWEYSFNEEPMANEITEALPQKLLEGSTRRIVVNVYERNPKARAECLKIHGETCFCCGFNFYHKYGNIGRGFIHVHHLKLISELGLEYEVNPEKDLLPVCPNCHAMIHQKKPPFTIEEIKAVIAKNA